MAHIENNENLSPLEKNYQEYISNGDGFMNISIYRNARECYQLALKTGVNDTQANEKLSDCTEKIHTENKYIIRILAVAIVIIGICVITMI